MSTLTEDSHALRSQLIADRLAGAQFIELAVKYGISVWTGRSWCRKAVKAGDFTQAELRMRNVRRPSLPVDAYHRQWLARVMRKIVVDANGCWRWQGFKGHTGYAQTGYRGAAMNGHRAMYIVHFGVKLATEQYVLHRCDVRDCINPDHLWLGTAKDNNNDCALKGRHYEGSKTHCHRGHEFTPENTKLYPNGRGSMSRKCLTCDRERFKRKTA
jgi:hypothetical protein